MDMEQWTGSKLGKEYVKAVYCQPAYLTYMQSTSWEMSVWMNHTGVRIAGRNLNNLKYADDRTLMAESGEELKSLLMKVKEESEKAGWNLNIQKAKTMASSLITSWQTEEEKVETVTDFTFLGSKITVDGNWSHEIKRHLLLGKKAVTKLKWKCSLSVVSDSLWSHGLEPARLLHAWDFPGKNTGVVCHSFSRGSSWPRDRTQASCIAGRLFTIWATRV